MATRRIALAVALAAAISSCATEPPLAFDVTLHEDSVEVYDPTYCTPPESYCRRPTASNRSYAVSLDVREGTLTMNVNNLTFTSDRQVALDSTVVTFVYEPYPCGDYHLRMVQRDDGLRGTWTARYDCHGLSAKGHLEGSVRP